MPKTIFKNPNWTPPTLISKRLILRPLVENDAASIFSYTCNPNVARWTTWEAHQSLQDSLSFIREAFIAYQNKEIYPLGITLKQEPNIVIGTIGLRKINNDENKHAAELAYALHEQHWGGGIMTEAAFELIQWAFQELSLHQVFARCSSNNIASCKIMEKLGMKLEETLKASPCGHKHFDIHIYSLLRQEWQGIPSNSIWKNYGN